MLYSLVRDYQAEERAHLQEQRDLAWFDEPWTIGGVAVRVMTLADYRTLQHIKNPLVYGGLAMPEDVAMFVWFMSVDYNPLDAEAKAIVLMELCEKDERETLAEAREYLDFIFQDDLPAQRGGQPRRTSATYVGSLVDCFANAYGWGIKQILDTELPQLFQLRRAIRRRMNPNAPDFTGAENATGRFLRWVNEQAPEEREAISARLNAGETIEIPD